MTFEQFMGDGRTYDAVLRNLEIIGDAVKNLPNEIRGQYPGIERKMLQAPCFVPDSNQLISSRA